MNKILTHIGITCIILSIGATLAIDVNRLLYPPPLICKIYTWDHPEGRVKRCQKVGSDVSGNYSPEEPTATEYVYPSVTPTQWEPWSTPTRTATLPPYPEPATATLEAYP